MNNKTWYYYGDGWDTFGNGDAAVDEKLPKIKSDEILARVDAVAICASDIKMINMGNEHPLFKNRDFESEPAILGHELSLTVVKVGENLQHKWKPGMRVGVQPDVYMNGIRYCIGVNVPGGMQKYMVLEKPIFYSDQGETIFEVDPELSYATVAQLEPNACVEAAYRKWAREEFKQDGSLLIYVGEHGDANFDLDYDLSHETVVLVTKGDAKQQYPSNSKSMNLEDALNYLKEGYNDILIIGDTEPDVLKKIIESLNEDGLFCWLPETENNVMVDIDIAKVHYSKLNWLGTQTKKLSDAFHKEKMRYELRENGRLLVMGGAGAMGRIHTLRAIMKPDGPKQIVVAARSNHRLQALLDDFKELASSKGKELHVLSTNEENWEKKMLELSNHEGFDDVIVSAPGTNPVDNAVPFMKKDGMLILFSGTKYGSYSKLPIGYVVCNGARINASSGSNVLDEKMVLDKISQKQSDLDANVMAIVGFNHLKEALLAVNEGRYPGKVIIYPQIDELPLIDIKQLEEFDKNIFVAAKHGWGRQAECALYHKYGKED